MTKVVAIMSMSLDGYVADANDGVAEVFDWYFSGDVEVPTASGTSGMTFRVSAGSADHLKGLVADVGAMLTGRRTFEVADGWDGQHPWDVPVFVATHDVPDGWPRPGSTVEFVTDGIESAVTRAKIGCRPEVRGSAWRPNDPAVFGRQPPRRDPHRSGCRFARGRSAAVRPSREHTGRPRESDSRQRCGCHTSALSGPHVVDPRA
jgi:dihydrofolate reductase